MRMNPERIMTRGFGETLPLITEGEVDAQAPNRRVEIKMRKTPPPNAPIRVTPKAKPIEKETPKVPKAPKAIPITPNREVAPARVPPVLKALVVPRRALPVEEDIPSVPKALPVEP
jgi:hypothetical protein